MNIYHLIKSSIFAAFLIFILFITIKYASNYFGYCTTGVDLRSWHRYTDDEVIYYIRTHGRISKEGYKTIYENADMNAVKGDMYYPASLLDKITGNSRLLVHYTKPWLKNTEYLITNGYFYANNCPYITDIKE